MDQVDTSLFATVLVGLAATIERYPWVALFLTVAPGLPAFLTGAFWRSVLFGLLGCVAVLVMAVSHGAGLLMWLGAWAPSIALACRRIRRRFRRPDSDALQLPARLVP